RLGGRRLRRLRVSGALRTCGQVYRTQDSLTSESQLKVPYGGIARRAPLNHERPPRYYCWPRRINSIPPPIYGAISEPRGFLNGRLLQAEGPTNLQFDFAPARGMRLAVRRAEFVAYELVRGRSLSARTRATTWRHLPRQRTRPYWLAASVVRLGSGG